MKKNIRSPKRVEMVEMVKNVEPPIFSKFKQNQH